MINTEKSSRRIPAQSEDMVVLKCNATGNPLPSFLWTKDGVVIGNKPEITIKISTSSKFGKYLCKISNFVGKITHTVIVFEVGK